VAGLQPRRVNANMRKIALTGGIATGKSYVLSRIRDAGVPVVDADVLAREAVAPKSEGLAAVVERFGKEVLTPEGFLDRARLGDIVFRDKAARRDLEAIVHPFVRRKVDEFFDGLASDHPFAVADIPLLYETGRQRQFAKVIVVATSREQQITRIMARDGLSREEAERRVAAQLPIEAKVALADYVIRTDGTHEETDAQVQRVLSELS
jgi:dephospho-CoA kinase